MARFVALRAAAVGLAAAVLIALCGAVFMFGAIGLGSTMEPEYQPGRDYVLFVVVPLLIAPVLFVACIVAWRFGNRCRDELDPWAGSSQ